jgi:hypothetical protein
MRRDGIFASFTIVRKPIAVDFVGVYLAMGRVCYNTKASMAL